MSERSWTAGLDWFQLELTRPLLLIGLLALPAILYYYRHSLVDFARWQMLLSLAVRSVIVALLVLCLAGLTVLRPTRELFVVFATDHSLSVGEPSRKKADEFIAKALPGAEGNRVAFLQFASEPAAVAEQQLESPVKLEENGTNLSAALEQVAASIPPFYVPRIVLLTDGNETMGDALKTTLSAEVPIWTVPLAPRDDPEVNVAAVAAPAQVAQGEPFHVEAVIDSNHDDEGQIEVFRGPHKLLSERKKITKGENRFRFQQSIDQERLAEFSVRISGFKDTLLDNNADSGLVFAAGKPRILLIDSEPKQAKDLTWALEQEGIVADVRPPQGMPDSLADLQNYELLILSNVPATALSMRQMEVARSYVQDLGGGLIMLGGDQSFGLGGYYKTLLEEILPVRSDFEKEKEKPSLAMVLVIDKSGSMGGDKIELAKDAAKSAVELLGPSDKVGVIAFEGETYWISEIHPCTDKGFVLDRVSSIEAGGGTDMYPALEEAYSALQSVTAKLKHVIVLTDGVSAPGDFEGIAGSMASARITVSTVAVGEDSDIPLLEEIARIGKGRSYFTNDPQSIPQIFAKETVTASKSAINEQPFVPQILRSTPALADINLESAPFLLGYVVTRPKPTCEMILATEAGDPLLVWWRYGLGMSAAFTSDAKSRWAAEWLSWPGYSKFWAQVVRQTMRKTETKGLSVQVAQKDRRTTVTLDSVEPSGKYLNGADTELTVISPRLGNQKIAMSQTAPGRYIAQFETADAGAYHLELAQRRDGATLHRQSRGLMVGYPEELRLRPTNEKLLESISRHSGGRYNPAPEEVFAADERTAQRATPLWPYLAIAAALLFVGDVALRRIDFSLVLGTRATTRKLMPI